MFFLASCTIPDRRQRLKRPVPVPASWQQAPSGPGPLDIAALPARWTRFNDPVLDELIAGALRSSPDVRSALSRIAEFRARRGMERAGLSPSLDANISGRRTRAANRVTDLAATRESYAASLDASWQVDLLGRQRRALATASANLAQTGENYYGAQVSLAAEVVALRSAETELALVHNGLGTPSEPRSSRSGANRPARATPSIPGGRWPRWNWPAPRSRRCSSPQHKPAPGSRCSRAARSPRRSARPRSR